MNAGAAAILLFPRNVCVGILTAYRAVISPLYGDVCRYYPSCSHYTLQAIQGHGVIRGVWLGTRRIARCHPWAAGGVDDVPQHRHNHFAVTRFGFVVFDQHSTISHGKG
jgi:putative membrane protein insertion efficiency factor